jgi:hypothetical protein
LAELACPRRSATARPRRRNALRAFAAIAERAGLAGVTLHTLRHSTASALIAADEHIKVVQEMLGHSSYAITADIYSHVNASQQRAAAERLGGLSSGDKRGYARGYIRHTRADYSSKKHTLTRRFAVGLARFELATP